MLCRGCVFFLLSDLMITLTYVLMENFCPCFKSTLHFSNQVEIMRYRTKFKKYTIDNWQKKIGDNSVL